LGEIKALERCAGGVTPSHRYWLGVCGVNAHEERRENDIFGGKYFFGADFGRKNVE